MPFIYDAQRRLTYDPRNGLEVRLGVFNDNYGDWRYNFRNAKYSFDIHYAEIAEQEERVHRGQKKTVRTLLGTLLSENDARLRANGILEKEGKENSEENYYKLKIYLAEGVYCYVTRGNTKSQMRKDYYVSYFEQSDEKVIHYLPIVGGSSC